MGQTIEIPASEVRERISDVISRVAYGGERVIISRNGNPQVALISIADLERLKQHDERLERIQKEALEALAASQAEAKRTGLDKMSDEEINRIVKEVRRELHAERERGGTE